MPSGNYRGVADRIDIFSAAVAVTASAPVLEDGWVGFPITSAAVGVAYTMHVEGEFEVEMLTGAATGDLVYFEHATGDLLLVPPAAGAGTNETQEIDFVGTVSGGSYKLTFDGETTGVIAWDAVAATVQTALLALSNLAPGDVVVSGGANPTSFTVTFGGVYAATDVPLMTADDALATGGGDVVVLAGVEGVPAAAGGASTEFGKVTRIAGDNGVLPGMMWIKISPYKHSESA